MVIPSIIVLLITAIIMILGLRLKETTLYNIVIIKELIWSLMTIIFIIVYIKTNKAQKALLNNDLLNAKKYQLPIATYYIPMNILLGIIAIFFGVIIRGL